MNQPEPHKPSHGVTPEELSMQPVSKADMLEVLSEVASMKDLLARIATAVEAPGIAEAVRQAEKAEAASKMDQAYASGELGYFSG